MTKQSSRSENSSERRAHPLNLYGWFKFAVAG
jgi:hypothetical protein